eukprot:gene30849-38130_t
MQVSVNGSVTLSAHDDLRVRASGGSLHLVSARSLTQDAWLSAKDSIVAWGSDDGARIEADHITLLAEEGSLGTDEFALQVNPRGTHLLDASALAGVHLTGMVGPLYLGTVRALAGNLRLRMRDTADAGEDLVLSAGTVLNASGTLGLYAADALRQDALAQISADGAVEIAVDLGDTGKQDAGGTSLTLSGTVSGSSIRVAGGRGDDLITLDATQLTGPTQVLGSLDSLAGGDDAIVLHALPHTTDPISVDGRGGSDRVTLQLQGDAIGLDVTVHDTGDLLDGANVLAIEGSSSADHFLVRSNFIARLVPVAIVDGHATSYQSPVQRINYDSTQTGRVVVMGLKGDDQFFVDDNSALMTLDGGEGDDRFQFGQMFGAARVAPQVAEGDEVETVQTTVGFLTRGIHYATVAYGGTGNDQFVVYSNAAELKLFGQDGDDNFVVRAFVIQQTQGLATDSTTIDGGGGNDTVEYNINAPLRIDGGAGINSLTVLGTEVSDNFVITRDGIMGAGLNVGYASIQRIEVDGLEGDDHFFVLSTKDDIVTTLIGGAGSDTFDVGGDVTGKIVALSTEGASAFVNHALASDDLGFDGAFAEGVRLNVAGHPPP